MGVLRTKYTEARDFTCTADSPVIGGRLVTLAVADANGKPRVRMSDSGEHSIGAALQDVAGGEDVTVVTRGVQWLRASEAVGFNVEVVAGPDGQVQGFASGETHTEDSKYGRSLAAAAAAGDVIPVLVH